MGWLLLDKGDTVYYPHPLKMQPNDKPMTVMDRYFAYYRKTGRKYIRYLYDGLLERLAEEMHENVRRNLDNVVIIYGREGTGKSTLAYWLMKTYDPDFDMEASYIHSFEDLIDKLHNKKVGKGGILWLDEAVTLASNRDWMRAENKQFMDIMKIVRSWNLLMIFCIPDMGGLDKYIREQRARYILEAQVLEWDINTHKERGYAELTRADYSDNFKREETVGFLKFPDIPAEVKREYDAIKEDRQDIIIREMYEKNQTKKGRDTSGGKALRMLLLQKRESGMSVKDIAEETGLAEQTVMNYCRQARRERGDKDDEC